MQLLLKFNLADENRGKQNVFRDWGDAPMERRCAMSLKISISVLAACFTTVPLVLSVGQSEAATSTLVVAHNHSSYSVHRARMSGLFDHLPDVRVTSGLPWPYNYCPGYLPAESPREVCPDPSAGSE
jgi:hypothetical protein